MDEPKTKEDIKNMLKHLEDEYRKANISEKTYKEMKEKYKSQMLYMENTISQEEAQQPAAGPETVETKEGGKKGGLLEKLLHKRKDEPVTESDAKNVAAEPPSAPPQEDATESVLQESTPPKESADNVSSFSIELEKIKAIIDTMREQKKAGDESIQSLFENVGEIRSMVIQSDANASELKTKMEQIQDDIAQVKPKEIDKKFRDISETLEKYQLSIEKLQAKSDDMAQKINTVHELLKSVGNVENLAKISSDVQKKLDDIKDATRYVERLASKTEKIFIDIKKELDDIVVYRTRQDAMDETLKDVVKNIDALGVKFEGYASKKDINDARDDIMLVKKDLETIKNTLGVVQSSVPETIADLRKQRDDIKIFLDSLEDQAISGKLKLADYQAIKSKNMEKLRSIEASLQEEWKKIESGVKAVSEDKIKSEKSGEKEAVQAQNPPGSSVVDENSVQNYVSLPDQSNQSKEAKPAESSAKGSIERDGIQQEDKSIQKDEKKENQKKKKKIEVNMPF